MNKKVLGLALIAVSAIAMTGVAQTPAATTSATQEKIRTDRKAAKESRKQVNPFEGLNLTDSQKTQLQQLDAKRSEARKQAARARKVDKQQKDSVRSESRKAAKKAYLAEVKTILTPEQYTVFLENMYVNGGAHKNHKKFADGRKDGKKHGDRKGMKGNRPDRRSTKSNS